VKLRVVFDSSTVVSALCFRSGRLRWLVQHWHGGNCTPLLSRATAAEITRVLAYPKLKLSTDERYEFLADYIPHCEFVEGLERSVIDCRDPRDQPFLDLAQSGKANVLVTGDADLLVLHRKTEFAIETPEDYRQRVIAE